MKPVLTTCSGCGERFDRSRGYSGSVINPYCRSKRCEALYLKNADAMAAAPLDLMMPFEVVNGLDNEHWGARAAEAQSLNVDLKKIDPPLIGEWGGVASPQLKRRCCMVVNVFVRGGERAL